MAETRQYPSVAAYFRVTLQ